MTDTNVVAQMVAAFQSKSETLAIVMIVIAFLTPLISAMSAYFSRCALSRTNEIHTVVNGNNTAMHSKLEAYTQEILRLSNELSALNEIRRNEAASMRLITKDQEVALTENRVSEIVRNEIAARKL